MGKNGYSCDSKNENINTASLNIGGVLLIKNIVSRLLGFWVGCD